MTCGCKHKKGKKRGSGRAHFLSGVTWHKGSGTSFTGGGFKKKRKKTKRGGMNFSGGGLKFVVNKKVNGRRVI